MLPFNNHQQGPCHGQVRLHLLERAPRQAAETDAVGVLLHTIQSQGAIDSRHIRNYTINLENPAGRTATRAT